MGWLRCCGNLGCSYRQWLRLLRALQLGSDSGRYREVQPEAVLRLLQLSDPHLLQNGQALYRGRNPLDLLRHGLGRALERLPAAPDLLLISGDLCQDESLGGYIRLRELLAGLDLPVALLPGNHDHPVLLGAALARRAALAPAELWLGSWRLLLLSSHRPARTEGWLGPIQLAWLRRRLAGADGPVLLAVHHPPLPIGDPDFDAIGLHDAPLLLEALAACPHVAAVLCGHVHQHWQGSLPGRPEVPLLACPSTLCAFPAVQPCPLGRPDDPGGRLLELGTGGVWSQRLLRWSPPDAEAG